MPQFRPFLALTSLLLGCASEADDGADCRTAANACSSGFECVQRSGAWTCRPEGEVVTETNGNMMTSGGTNGGDAPTVVLTPPAAEAALTTTVSLLPSGSCTDPRGPLSIGESSSILLSGSPGTGRVVNGTNGSVACTVAPNGTGVTISADIDADALELNGNGVPYHQQFGLHATYPTLAPHAAGATASISATDTRTQSNRADGACVLDVLSTGADGTGGALFASFNCSNFADANMPGIECRFTGTIVLENCEK